MRVWSMCFALGKITLLAYISSHWALLHFYCSVAKLVLGLQTWQCCSYELYMPAILTHLLSIWMQAPGLPGMLWGDICVIFSVFLKAVAHVWAQDLQLLLLTGTTGLSPFRVSLQGDESLLLSYAHSHSLHVFQLISPDSAPAFFSVSRNV